MAVETAAEMEGPSPTGPPSADVVIMAAAVADFRPKEAADHKMKKADGLPEVVLEPTPDILAALGARRRPGQVLVGFAAETGDGRPALRRARQAGRKGLDLIVANDVAAPGVGFAHDTNAVVLVGRRGRSDRRPPGRQAGGRHRRASKLSWPESAPAPHNPRSKP